MELNHKVTKDQMLQHLNEEYPGAIEHVKALLKMIGDDPDREGLQDTPFRVVKSWMEIYGGYQQDPKVILSTAFADGMECMTNEIVMCKNITFTSVCEHHMLPFTGKAHLGYLPDKKVVGLSKLARLVDCFANRLQIQEKMCADIADSLMGSVEPEGVGVIIEASHLCMACRGVKKSGASMVTSAMRGKFMTQTQTRNEFLQLIKTN
jgi:GTP cyclohydrolase I